MGLSSICFHPEPLSSSCLVRLVLGAVTRVGFWNLRNLKGIVLLITEVPLSPSGTPSANTRRQALVCKQRVSSVDSRTRARPARIHYNHYNWCEDATQCDAPATARVAKPKYPKEPAHRRQLIRLYVIYLISRSVLVKPTRTLGHRKAGLGSRRLSARWRICNKRDVPNSDLHQTLHAKPKLRKPPLKCNWSSTAKSIASILFVGYNSSACSPGALVFLKESSLQLGFGASGREKMSCGRLGICGTVECEVQRLRKRSRQDE